MNKLSVYIFVGLKEINQICRLEVSIIANENLYCFIYFRYVSGFLLNESGMTNAPGKLANSFKIIII